MLWSPQMQTLLGVSRRLPRAPFRPEWQSTLLCLMQGLALYSHCLLSLPVPWHDKMQPDSMLSGCDPDA